MHISKRSTEFIKLNSRECIGCMRCVKICPGQVIGKAGFLWHKHAVLLNTDACIGCDQCVDICPKKCFTTNR